MFNQIKLIVLLVVIAGAVYFIWDYQSTKEENKRLTGEISAANNIINQLDIKNQSEKIITENEETIIEDIRHAPQSDDGVVAPVLDRAIDRLHNTGSN